jgi:acetylornithine aminotransferase/acetylornithine/N-succinyldiaminopimelate aminotransferase
MTTMTDVKALEAQKLLQIFRRFPVVFVRGAGTRLFDQDGRSYLDFLSGIGVASLGHAHPVLTRALQDQVATLVQTSNLYYHPLQGELAARLTALTGLERAFFCNSGTEAMEACLKFARRFWFTQGKPRTKFVALAHGFHGRTMGALSITWDDHYRAPFAPLVPGAVVLDADDPDALGAAVDDDTAAIVVEPIRGEGGVRPIPPALAAAIVEASRRTGALIIADEVQSGSWRTGTFLRSGAVGIKPDLVALAKALGAGVPVGAVVMADRVAASIAPGDHGTTYGGNLLACRAALTFLEVVDGGVGDSMRRVSAYMFDRLHALAAASGGAVVDVRGAGMIAGLELAADALPVTNAALERGLIVNRTSGNVVRLLPPYIATQGDVDEALDILTEALGALR